MHLHPRYHVIQQIAQSRFSTIYRARDQLSQCDVALKTLHASKPYRDAPAIFDVLTRLQHPHIITALDAIRWQQQPTLVLQWLPDAQPVTLAAQGAAFQVRLRWLHQTLHALVYLHHNHILHRDLKPSNVLVSAGDVTLLDFGLSKQHGVAATRTERPGTLAYLSPEVLDAGTYSPASDLFALGVLAYEMLSGMHPFGAFDAGYLERVRQQEPPPLGVGQPELQAWLLRLLSKDPAARSSSAMAALHDLQSISAHNDRQPLHSDYSNLTYSNPPLLGREPLLRDLQQRAERASNDRGQAVLIAGESGTGKSRLLDYLHGMLGVVGYLVVRVGADEHLQADAWWQPFVEQLTLGTTLSADERAALQTPDDKTHKPEQIAGALLSLIERQTLPVALLLDNLHSTQQAWPVLATLANDTTTHKLFIVAAFRDDIAPDLPQELADADVLHMPRLSVTDLRQLASLIWTPDALPDAVLDALLQCSGGNPLLASEALAQLATEHRTMPDAAQVVQRLQTLQSQHVHAWAQHYQRLLPAWVQGPLRLCALYQRRIEPRLLVAWLHDATPERWLWACAPVLRQTGAGWQFRHEQIRHSILAPLKDAERRDYHAKLADTLESSELAVAAPVLAQHWRAADRPEGESLYVQAAARHFLRIDDRPQAKTWALRAVELIDHTPSQAVQAHLLAGRALRRLSDYDAARAHYESALSLQPLHSEAAEVHIGLGEVAVAAEDYDTGRQQLRAALAALPQTPENRELRARATYQLGSAYMMQGHYADALPHFEHCLGDYDALNDDAGIAITARQIGICAFFQGLYPQAQQHYETSLTHAQRAGDIGARATALRNLGIIAYRQGDHAASLDYYEQALTLEQRYGTSFGVAAVLINRAVTLENMGDYAGAREQYITARERFAAINHRSGMATCDNNLASLAHRQGDDAGALAYAQSSLALRVAINDITGQISSHRSLATSYGRQGHLATAIQHYDQAEALMDANGAEQFRHNIWRGRAGIYAEQGDYDAALDLLKRSLTRARQQHAPSELANSHHDATVISSVMMIYLLVIGQADP